MSLRYWLVGASSLASALILAVIVFREIRRVVGRLRELEVESGGGPRAGDVGEARALALLLIQEIELYHGEEVALARAEGRVLERLATELERARAIYEQSAPGGARSAGDPFAEVVLERLAGGDPGRLGPAPPEAPIEPG